MGNNKLPKPEEILGSSKKLPSPADILGETVKKKPLSVSQSPTENLVSETISEESTAPVPQEQKPLDYQWSNQKSETPLIQPSQAELQKAIVEPEVYRSEQTDKLKTLAATKQDEVIKNSSAMKSEAKVIEFAADHPEVKQLNEIEAQITAMGQPTMAEDVVVFNSLIDQRNALLETDVAKKNIWDKAPNIEAKKPSDFDTMSEYLAYQNQVKKEFGDFDKKKKDFEEVSPKFTSTKLKDVLATAQGSAAKQQELLAKIQVDQKEAEESIKAAQELNKDKLVPLGFFDGFAEGMEQTTLTNTIADLYIGGKEEELQKALENLYTDQLAFPKQTTTSGAAGELLGGQVKPLAVGIGGAVASELTTGNPLLGIVAGSGYYSRMGLGSGLMDGYTTARSQGKTQTEAYEIAKAQSKAGAIGGAAEGAVAAIPFLGKPLSKIATTSFKNAVVGALKDNSVDAVVAGISQYAQNKNLSRLGLDRESSEGVAENMAAEFILGAGMNMAFFGGSKINPENYNAIIAGLAKLPLADIQAKVDEGVKSGVLDAARAQKTMSDISVTSEALKAMPQDISEETEAAVLPKVVEIKKLEEENKNVVDAFKEVNNEKIKSLNVEIAKGLLEAEPVNKRFLDYRKERERIDAVFAADWGGLSDEQMQKNHDELEANEMERDKLFDEFATDEEKKQAKKLADKATSKFENLKEKIGLGQNYYDRSIAENNYKEEIVNNRITDQKGLVVGGIEIVKDGGTFVLLKPDGNEYSRTQDLSHAKNLAQDYKAPNPFEGEIKTDAKDTIGSEGKNENEQGGEAGVVDERTSVVEESKSVAETKPVEQGEGAIASNTEEAPVKPIRQLGTGSNVYFEADKYRVNDSRNGKILLNVGDANGEVPLANVEFDNASEAVYVANKLQENAPEGLVSDYHNVEKIISNFKEDYKNKNAKGAGLVTPAFAEPKRTRKEVRAQNRKFKLEILESEPTTPRQWVQQFFAGGGKVATEDVKRETGFGGKDAKTGKGRNMAEFRKRIWMHSGKGDSIDKIIESLQEDWRTNHGGELDYDDARNTVLDVINSYDTPSSMLEDLRKDFAVGDRVVADKNERIYAQQEQEMAQRHEYEQEMIKDIPDESLEEANLLLEEVEGRPLTEAEIESEAKDYDEYFNSLSKEEQEKELNSLYYEADQRADKGTEGETNAENKSTSPVKDSSTKERTALEKRIDGLLDTREKSRTPVAKEPTRAEKAKQKFREKLDKAKAIRDSQANKLSAIKDPIKEAEELAKADREVFDAAVEVAKEYIKETADKALHTLEDFAKFLGEKAEDVKKAWEAATKEPEEVKKTITTKRAYEGEFRQEVRKELETLGLTREVESRRDAKAKAIEFVDSVGGETALEAVRNNDVSDAAGAYVWNELIERNEKRLATEADPDKIIALQKEQAQLIDELSRKALSGGRFSSALGDIYQNSDLGYNVEKKIADFKDQNGGEISPEIEGKFRELDKQYQEVKKQLAEAEERAKKAEEQLAVDNIKESVEREKKAKRTYKAKAKEVADEIRKLKTKPFQFTDENGNVYDVTTMGVTWNDVVETVAKAVEAGGKIADAIENALSKTDWYKNFSEKDKEAFRNQLADHIASLGETTTGKVKVPHSLIRDLVESGIDNIDDLTKAVHERFPKATEREVRDAITGYGKTANPNMQEVEVAIRKMKRAGRIISALEDIAEKKRPLRSGQQRDKLDAEERAMQKELREAMKELPVDEADLQAELKTQLDATKARVQNQIEDLQREIEKGELTPKNARTVKEDDELKELKAKRDKLKEEHDKIFKDEEYKEQRRLELTKKATERRIEDLQKKLKEGDYTKKARKPLVADSELIKLKADKLRIQEEYDKEFYKNKLRNRTKAEVWKDRVWDAWGLTRGLSATGEASFVGIQGLVQTIAHPKHAIEAFKNAAKFFTSTKKTEDWLRNIKSQDFYPALKGSKLSLTEPHAEVTAREELFYSGWTDLIWNTIGAPFKLKSQAAFENWKAANPIKAIERASVGYLDTIRVMRFLDGMEILKEQGKTFENSPQDYKDVADAINTLTGRASLGAAEQNAEKLSKLFFSPRNWASQFKTATPYALYHFGKMTPTARKMAIADFSKFVGLTTSMVMAAAAGLNNDDDPETSVEFDPRSSDFMKIKLGKKRIDPWGGRIQQVVLTSRLLMDVLHDAAPSVSEGGMKTSKGEIVPLGTPFKAATKGGVALKMAINKMAPSAALLERYLVAQEKKDGTKVDEYGKEYSAKKEILESLRPIYWGTVSDLMKDDPNALNGLLAFYAFFGGGVSVYDKGKSDKTTGTTQKTIKAVPLTQRLTTPNGNLNLEPLPIK